MARHSHWKSIKRVKEAEDKKRAQFFSKLSRQISLAVRLGGPDPHVNQRLNRAIESARALAMPKENIERAIKKAAGELSGEKLEEVLFEAHGPGGIALIIEGITDNKNRTLGEIKQLLSQYNGKLVQEGSVRWMFERQKKGERLEWLPKYEVELSGQDKMACEKLFEALEENDAVQEIYSNLKG